MVMHVHGLLWCTLANLTAGRAYADQSNPPPPPVVVVGSFKNGHYKLPRLAVVGLAEVRACVRVFVRICVCAFTCACVCACVCM